MGASNAKVGIFDPETEEEAVVDNGALHVIVDSGGGTTGGATEATLLKLNGFSLPVYDSIVPTFNATSDVWVYKTGGASGATVATLTVSYTDATKAVITSVVRT